MGERGLEKKENDEAMIAADITVIIFSLDSKSNQSHQFLVTWKLNQPTV